MYFEHVSLLRCPHCGNSYKLEIGQSDPIIPDYVVVGMLKCQGCVNHVHIQKGIPRFTGEEYVTNFSFQWKQFKNFEVIHPIKDDTYFSEGLGLSPKDVESRRVLEVGCGSGRAMRHFKKGNPRLYVAIDMSNSVEVVEEDFRSDKNCLIIQADLTLLPLQFNFFDVVFSYGVLHHTPSPNLSFQAIARHVAENGILSVWVYTVGTNFGIISRFVQRRSQKIPRLALLLYCHLLSNLGVLLNWFTKLPLKGQITWFPIYVAQYFFRINPSGVRSYSYLVAHDYHTTKFVSEHTAPEVYGWFSEAGFKNMMPLRACGMKGYKLSVDKV